MRGNAVEIPTFKGHGLQAGVDLDDTSELLDLMDDTKPTIYQHAPVNRRSRRKVAEPAGKDVK